MMPLSSNRSIKENILPAAVSVGPRSPKQVDYALLGITRPAR